MKSDNLEEQSQDSLCVSCINIRVMKTPLIERETARKLAEIENHGQCPQQSFGKVSIADILVIRKIHAHQILCSIVIFTLHLSFQNNKWDTRE